MPKVKQNHNSKLKKYVSEFGENIFSTDGLILYCKICDVKVSSEKKFHIQQHIGRDKHKNALAKIENSKKIQPFINKNTIKSDFNYDLCNALVAANIPMNKLNNDVFRSFLSKYCNKNIPCESTLRKGYFDKCYEEVLSKIREAVGEHKIWVCIDETTDSERRNVANIIVGILQPESPGNLYLLHTDYLDKVNSSTITQLFDKAMHILWPTNVKYDNILLFISDAAPYMKKAGSTIQTLYPNIIHLTCLAHACHNVCEEVRAYYKNVDQLVSEMKKTFLKCPKRIAVLKEKCPELPNPPRPIITRWGTWINAVKYYCTNFNELKSIIEEFEEESECVRAAKRLFKMPSIQSNLVYIVSNFGFLPDTITKLETRGNKYYFYVFYIFYILKYTVYVLGVLLSKSVDIVNNIQIKLEECNGEIAKLILDKFNKVISKNKGWENIKKINQVLIGETTSDDDLSSSNLNLDNYLSMKYAPITSVDVERSFSMYKNILTPNRSRFSEDSLSKYMVVNFFF